MGVVDGLGHWLYVHTPIGYNEIKSEHVLLPCELILNKVTPGRFYNSTDAAWQNFKSIHIFISKAII